MAKEFCYNLTAKRTRVTDADLIGGLQSVAEAIGGGYFSTAQYDDVPGKRPHFSTIIERFGSWKKALALIGIAGGREFRYSPEQLIANLEVAWRQLGFPPGKRQIAAFGEKISEAPYKRHWGSVRSACEALAAFHDGKVSRESLLAGRVVEATRKTIPLKDRWVVLKRDNYTCTKCGASPSSDHRVESEVDHVIPIARGGGNAIENLQTLCKKCNQGKKDR
jgi:hypothetical protein